MSTLKYFFFYPSNNFLETYSESEIFGSRWYLLLKLVALADYPFKMNGCVNLRSHPQNTLVPFSLYLFPTICYISFNSLKSVNEQLHFKKINDTWFILFSSKFSHSLKVKVRGGEGKS